MRTAARARTRTERREQSDENKATRTNRSAAIHSTIKEVKCVDKSVTTIVSIVSSSAGSQIEKGEQSDENSRATSIAERREQKKRCDLSNNLGSEVLDKCVTTIV
jgi:hypothetical protein